MAHREDIQPNVDKARANRHPFLKSWIETSKPLLFNSKPTGDPFTPPHVVTESPSSLQLYGLRAHSSPVLPLTYAIATANNCVHSDRTEDLMSGASSSGGLRAALSYCVQQVRNYDYHNYLCLLELPPNMRKAAFALCAFNVETSRAMDVSSNPKIGLMRLLWWQEALDKLYANKSIEHPVAQALASVISQNKISKSWLKRSVEARINDSRREHTDIPKTVEELERYAEDTASTILYSTLQAGGIRSTVADHAASHIGKANGLLLLLRSLPYHANRNRHHIYIPADVAEKHGLLVHQSGQSEVRLDSHESMCDAVFDMASVANAHLQKARELRGKVPADARPVLLSAVPAQVILDSLSRVQFDVFDPRLTRGILGAPPLLFQLKLKWYSWRGTY